MALTKFFRIGFMAAAIWIMAASMGQEVEAGCRPCNGPAFFGQVTMPNGTPAKDGTIVYAVCTEPLDCGTTSEQCPTSGGGYAISPGDGIGETCGTEPGHYDVWARLDDGNCVYQSVVVNYDWDCGCQAHGPNLQLVLQFCY